MADPSYHAEGISAQSSDFTLVLDSGLFDHRYYAGLIGEELTPEDAVAHYIEQGEGQGLAPSEKFDPELYGALYPDVVAARMNRLAHYIRYGAFEGRYATRTQLTRDAELLVELLPAAAAASLPGRRSFDENGLTAMEAHIGYRWRTGDRAVTEFDDIFYHNAYEDVSKSGMVPMLHYAKVGKAQGRVANASALQALASLVREGMDDEFYASQGALRPGLDAAADYAALGWLEGKDPHPDFSTNFYLESYRDVAVTGINPYAHFLEHGRREGRLGRPDFSSVMRRGAKSHSRSKRTVLIATHEASRTGAPLLALDVGRELAKTCNVIFHTPITGALYDDLISNACFVAVGRFATLGYSLLLEEMVASLGVDVLIANSVETVDMIDAALSAGLPSVALIHEFADYTLPSGRVTRAVLAADVAVFSATLLANAAQTEVATHRQQRSLNVRVRHQGKLESLGKRSADAVALSVDDIRELIGAPEGGKVRIVLGAGQVQTRKGVDTFVQTADEVRRIYGEDVRFVWVGPGYTPDNDIHCAVWVRSAVERLGLENTVFFLPEQPDIEAFYDVCDVMFLSSRLDPFPNVAIDALAAGRRIVCFENATGVAEWISDGRIEGGVARYGSVSEAAAAIVASFDQPRYSDRNVALAAADFQMGDYVDAIQGFVEDAIAFRETATATAARLRDSGQFDAAFYGAVKPTRRTADRMLLDYVVGGLKGVIPHSPKPGFNDALYRVQTKQVGASVVPLDDATGRSGQASPTTHRCHLVGAQAIQDAGQPELAVAIHLHLHYADLAEEFARQISEAFDRADVFITVTSEKGRRIVDYAFRDYENGKVTIDVVKNRGRDIVPMIHVLKKYAIAENYAVFGHFHGKKQIVDGVSLGGVWREFLVETLIGDHRVGTDILNLFAADDDLGLVFAEDRLGVSWTKNRRFADALAKRMVPVPTMPELPVFPLGTMFWSRPVMFAPLLNVEFQPGELPVEPLPNDGTMLHAIERMLPAIAESLDLTWATIRREGVNRAY